MLNLWCDIWCLPDPCPSIYKPLRLSETFRNRDIHLPELVLCVRCCAGRAKEKTWPEDKSVFSSSGKKCCFKREINISLSKIFRLTHKWLALYFQTQRKHYFAYFLQWRFWSTSPVRSTWGRWVCLTWRKGRWRGILSLLELSSKVGVNSFSLLGNQ